MPHARTRLPQWVARLLLVAGVSVAASWALGAWLPAYLVYLAITAVVTTIALLGLGVVTGTAGMIALCQMSFAAIGAWTVTWMNSVHAPGGFLLWVITGAAAAAVLGVLVGLPALRLRGVNLAVVTLGFAAAIDATLTKAQFPGSSEGLVVTRPAAFLSDRSYLLVCCLILIVVAAGLHTLRLSRVGAGWRVVAYSERAAAASGASVASLKLLAFAVSAAVAGISGGMIAGQVGAAYPASFGTMQSLALYLLAILAGTQYVEMAVLGGVLSVLVPELLKHWGVPQDWALVLFGALGIQSLAAGSPLGQDLRDWLTRRRAMRRKPESPNPPAPAVAAAMHSSPRASGTPVLELRGLHASFGSVVALDRVDLDVPRKSIVGLIGPNGAGKSTLVDVVSGFTDRYDGEVILARSRLDALPVHRRARAGLRRTFQQGRVPASLTVGHFLAFVAGGALDQDEMIDLLLALGCPPPDTAIATVDIGTRRLIEVAAQLASRPRVLILDEPAAGLSHDEHIAFGERLKQLPERYDVSILLIEHDLDLIRHVCDSVTVLDFGVVIATGAPTDVLANGNVLAAYMGEVGVL
jgi:branched-chain amino acid transport system permease protein